MAELNFPRSPEFYFDISFNMVVLISYPQFFILQKEANIISAKLLKTLLFLVLLISALPGLVYSQDDDVNLEVLEAIHEAPDIIEHLVISPEKGVMSSPWVLGGLVFVLTFLIEEVAIGASAYFVGSDRITYIGGFFSLYSGIFFSDLFLYGLGVLIRRSRWIRGYVDLAHYQSRVQGPLNRGLFVAIAIARLIPAMLIPIFLMLGFTGTDLRKVGFVNLFITGMYSFAALYLLLFMGLQVSDLMGAEVGLGLVATLIVYLCRQKLWNFFRTHYYLFRAPKAHPWPVDTHKGMPCLDVPRKLTFFEWLPYSVVYLPVYFAYFFYALRFRTFSAPLAANPGMENSGICGESKSKILSYFAEQFSLHIPRFINVRPSFKIDEILEQMQQAGLSLPVIAKPDIGYMSRGVELISDTISLRDYLYRFPQGQTIILQEYVVADGEAGIYYSCHPSRPQTPVINIALTYSPFVIGNGSHSLGQLVRNDPRFSYFANHFELRRENYVPDDKEIVRLKITGSAQDGCIHKILLLNEGSPLSSLICQISQSIPEFWIGRFDVKFINMESLFRGEFKILELNGASGEDLTAWDPRKGIIHCYRTLFRQVRYLFEIGRENQRRGLVSVSGKELLKAYIEQESLLYRLARAKYRKGRVGEEDPSQTPLILSEMGN